MKLMAGETFSIQQQLAQARTQIQTERQNIARAKEQASKLKTPPRTIQWQLQNKAQALSGRTEALVKQTKKAKQQYASEIAGAESKLNIFEGQVAEQEAIVKDIVEEENTRATLIRAAEKGKLWLHAAWGEGREKQMARQMIKAGVPASEVAMQREYDEGLKYKLQLLELKNQGFTPIYSNGKLTGFEDKIGQMSIPLENLGGQIQKYSTPAEVERLQKVGAIEVQTLKVPSEERITFGTVTAKYTPEQEQSLLEFNKMNIFGKAERYLSGKTSTGDSWNWQGLYKSGLNKISNTPIAQNLAGAFGFTEEKAEKLYKSGEVSVFGKDINLWSAAYETTTSYPMYAFLTPTFTAKDTFKAFDIVKQPKKLPIISYTENLQPISQRLTLGKFKINVKVPAPTYKIRTFDEILLRKPGTIIKQGTDKLYTISTPKPLKIMDGYLVSKDNFIISQRVGAKQFKVGTIFGKQKGVDWINLGTKSNVDKALVQKLAEVKSGRPVSFKNAPSIIGKKAQYNEGDLILYDFGKARLTTGTKGKTFKIYQQTDSNLFKFKQSGKSGKIEFWFGKPKPQLSRARLITRSEEVTTISKVNNGIKLTRKLTPEQSENLLFGDIAFKNYPFGKIPRASGDINTMRGLTKINEPLNLEGGNSNIITTTGKVNTKSNFIQQAKNVLVESKAVSIKLLPKQSAPTIGTSTKIVTSPNVINNLITSTSVVSLNKVILKEQQVPRSSERLFEGTLNKPQSKTVTKIVEKVIQKESQKPISKMIDKTIQKTTTKTIQKPLIKTIQKTTTKITKPFEINLRISQPKNKIIPAILFSRSSKKKFKVKSTIRKKFESIYSPSLAGSIILKPTKKEPKKILGGFFAGFRPIVLKASKSNILYGRKSKI